VQEKDWDCQEREVRSLRLLFGSLYMFQSELSFSWPNLETKSPCGTLCLLREVQ
jgi:hypothetical protein